MSKLKGINSFKRSTKKLLVSKIGSSKDSNDNSSPVKDASSYSVDSHKRSGQSSNNDSFKSQAN